MPKAGCKTGLIFHLSYNFSSKIEHKSVNFQTPQDICKVKYQDLDCVVRTCLQILKDTKSGLLYFGKTDLVSTFRILPLLPEQRSKLLMKARHPISRQWYFFIDKCLPFGSSISCALFQLFSDTLAHILKVKLGVSVVNYLDDFLFISVTKEECNHMVRTFLSICQSLGCPVSGDKTEWASNRIVFLGILLDEISHCLALLQDKCNKALNMIGFIKSKRKATMKEIQKLAGYMNFLQKAVVPGCTFTRRMYDKLRFKTRDGMPLKPHHHLTLDSEFKYDCTIWEIFLSGDVQNFCRPFVDLSRTVSARTLFFYSDASLNKEFGFGAVFKNKWTFGRWASHLIAQYQPSTEFFGTLCISISVVHLET